MSRQSVRAILPSASDRTAASASCTAEGKTCTADVIDVAALSYATADSFIVAKGSYPFRLLLVDAMSGAITTKLERPTQGHWALWPSLSTASAAVFSPDGILADAGAESGRLVADVLDLTTGQVAEGALDIALRP